MRLTRKTKSSWGNDIYYTNGQISSGIVYIDDNKNFTNAAIDKLGQYEDIEEELGIDLLTLFKAISCGCYYEDKDKNILFASDVVIGYKYIVIVDNETKYFMWNKNYGKTWALTKEELENGN